MSVHAAFAATAETGKAEAAKAAAAKGETTKGERAKAPPPTAPSSKAETAKADENRKKPLQRCDELADKAQQDCLQKARQRIVEARKKREGSAAKQADRQKGSPAVENAAAANAAKAK
jgi:hypothetical protein